MNANTFPAALAKRLRAEASQPVVTFYDLATGERTELSVATYANWVAKTAGLLQSEFELARGDLVLLDLDTHWLGPVWLAAAWAVGARVSLSPADAGVASLIACGQARVTHYRGPGAPANKEQRLAAPTTPIVAMSLLPMAARIHPPLDHAIDFSEVIWAMPDSFAPWDAPSPDDVALTGGATPNKAELHHDTETQAQLLESSRAETHLHQRLVTSVPATSPEGMAAFLGPLLSGHGTVWVSPDARGVDAGSVAPQVPHAELRRLALVERGEVFQPSRP